LGREQTTEIGSDRLKLDGWDVFTNRLRPYLGKTFVHPGDKGLLGSTEWIPLKSKPEVLDCKILQAFLLSQEYIQTSRKLMSGKNHPRISEFDLYHLQVPRLGKEIKDKIKAKIFAGEAEIERLKKKLVDPLDFINQVFGELVKKDLVKHYKEFGRGMTAGLQKSMPRALNAFEAPLSQIHDSFGLRVSSRFHRPQTEELTQLLENVGTVKAKHLIKKIRKGDQPKYVEDGDVPVIKTANLKNGYIDLEEAQVVSEGYFKFAKAVSGVTKGNILWASTGKVSLGKIDIYEENEPALASVDLLIVEVVPKFIDPYFFAYYFRSLLGSFQVERDFSGTTNQIHLYPEQVNEFEVLDLPLKVQQEVVKSIKSKLNEQDKVKNEIANIYASISNFINTAVK
jgi:type I restriction enzyme S subunit